MASSPTGAVYDPTPGTGKNRVILRFLLATFLAHFDEVVAKYGRAFFPVKHLTSALAAVDKKKYEEGDAAFVQLSAWSKLIKSKFDHDNLHITRPRVNTWAPLRASHAPWKLSRSACLPWRDRSPAFPL